MQVTADPDVRRRKAIIAGLLSLLIPGWGQVYNTQLTKGVVLFGVAVLLPFLLLCTPLALSFKSVLVVVALVVVYRLYVVIDAVRIARRLGDVRLRWVNRWYVYSAFWLMAAAVSLFIDPMLRELRRVDLNRIPTPAMSPTLLIGDYLVADMWYYNDRRIAAGDVVVFYPPREPQTLYVKRWVAVGGDSVEVEAGVLYVNNRRASTALQGWRDETEVMPVGQSFPGMWSGQGNPDHFGPEVVPEGHVFLMGDTRDNSEDSRFFGPVAESEIQAKVLYLYFRGTRIPGFRDSTGLASRLGSQLMEYT